MAAINDESFLRSLKESCLNYGLGLVEPDHFNRYEIKEQEQLKEILTRLELGFEAAFDESDYGLKVNALVANIAEEILAICPC
jgi:hypothetical protein